jgi:hypothetical protein
VSQTPTPKQLHDGLVNASLARLCRATETMGGDPFLLLICGGIQQDATVAEIDQRFPINSGMIEALAIMGAMGCNAYPKGEREQMAERFIAKFREKFADTQDMVDGWIAKIDPMRAMAREKAKAGGQQP